MYCCSHVPKSGPGHFDQTSVGIRQALNVPKSTNYVNEQIRGHRNDSIDGTYVIKDVGSACMFNGQRSSPLNHEIDMKMKVARDCSCSQLNMLWFVTLFSDAFDLLSTDLCYRFMFEINQFEN